MIGFDRKLDYKMHSHKQIKLYDSNLLIAHCEINSDMYVIANVYLHPKETKPWLGEILIYFYNAVMEYECKRVKGVGISM